MNEEVNDKQSTAINKEASAAEALRRLNRALRRRPHIHGGELSDFDKEANPNKRGGRRGEDMGLSGRQPNMHGGESIKHGNEGVLNERGGHRGEDVSFLRGTGLRILRLLTQESSVSASDIVEKFDIRPSSVSEEINKLENHGLIVRVKDENDGRRFSIFITESGKAHVSKINNFVYPEEKVFLILTKEEKAEFVRIVNKICEALDQ